MKQQQLFKLPPTLAQPSHFASCKESRHYTPPLILNPLRRVLGEIDLDPASDETANQIVRANRYFSQGGLFQPWEATTLLCNPPGDVPPQKPDKKDPNYSQLLLQHAGNRAAYKKAKDERKLALAQTDWYVPGTTSASAIWWQKFRHEFDSGNFSCGLFVGFNAEVGRHCLDQWDFPVCIPRDRVAFLSATDLQPQTSPTRWNLLVFVGRDRALNRRFKQEFDPLVGRVVGGA